MPQRANDKSLNNSKYQNAPEFGFRSTENDLALYLLTILAQQSVMVIAF
jgi:hypothetical protein